MAVNTRKSDKVGLLKINRTNDAVFKNIFANKKYKDITLSFINAVLEFEGTAQLKDITFLDREINGEYDNEKDSRLDLLGESSDGTKVNIEIQVASISAMGKRSLFYWCRIYNDLDEGHDYTELKRTVSINVLDFNLFESQKYTSYHSCFGIYDIKTGNHLTDDFEIHFVELPKWKQNIINDKEEIDNYKLKTLNRLEKWICYFSKRTSEKELEAIAMTEPAIKKALDAESIFMHDKTMWWEYEKAEKTRRDKIAQMNYWKNEARLEGLQQGIQQGSLSTLINLVKKGMLTVQEAAEEAGMSVAEFQNKI